MTADRRWWDRAACRGHPPEWWTAEGRAMWPEAVRICLACPVSQPCHDEAMRLHEDGVVRAATLLAVRRGGRHVATSLVCARCGRAPVRLPSDYCGQTCRQAATAAGSPATGGRRVRAGAREQIMSVLAAQPQGVDTAQIAAETGLPSHTVAISLGRARSAGLVVQPQPRGPWKLAGSAATGKVDQR